MATNINDKNQQTSSAPRQNVIAPINRPTPRAQAQTSSTPIPKRVSYEDMYKRLNVNPALTPEQVEKQQKREKWGKIASAIGDGISSLANLYFTTKGAPSSYNPRTPTLSQATGRKWAQIYADQNERVQAYIRGLERARAKDDELAQKEREWQNELAINAQKQKQNEAEEKRKQEMHEQDLAAAEAEARKAKTEADYAPEYQQSRINQNKASASASNARARSYGSGSGGGAEKYYGSFLRQSYKTEADYKKDVLAKAKELEVPITKEIIVEDSILGKKKKIVDRDMQEIAADIERKIAKEEEYKEWESNWDN